MTNNEKKFILGLEKLTRETGIAIHGCGCCGSPFLREVEVSKDSGYSAEDCENISWADPKDDFWDYLKDNIVK